MDTDQEDPSTANDDVGSAKPSGGDSAPQPDHSEREWGGDQDIDTAGMVPGNKATDEDEPNGV